VNVAIRPMTTTDKPEIINILRALPEFEPSEISVAAEVIARFLADPAGSGYYFRVAVADELPIGYVCYGPTPLTRGTWDIYWLAVARNHQGQSIGRTLMKQAEADIKRMAGRLIIIETSSKPEYKRTRDFYHGGNYRLAGRIPDFYAPGDDKLILQKRLTD